MKVASQCKSSVAAVNSSKSKSKDSKYKTININSANVKKRKRNNIKYITQLDPKTERKKVTSQSSTATTKTNGVNGKEFASIKTTSTLTSSIISNNNSQVILNNTIDSIFVKLKSNWGHSSLIALHCINLYTSHKALIKVISTSVSYEPQRLSSNIQTVKQQQHPNTVSPLHNSNNNDITSIRFIKGQIVVIEIKYNAVTLIKEIELINSKHPNKTVSAKEILICNVKGELIYADALQKGGKLHIEKGINGLFIPIKHRIVVNRKQHKHNSPIKKECSELLFKRVNSNDHFSKVKTLSNFPNPITNNQLVSLLHNSRCLTSRYNKVQFDSIVNNNNNNYSSQTQRTNNNVYDTNKCCLEREHMFITCNKITIILLSNYGHCEHIGLTGIEIYDDRGMVDVANRAKGIWTQPKDLNTVYNDSYDDRIFENTFNGVNNTTNQSHMWLTCLEGNTTSKPYIEMSFGEDINLDCIKFYNYNHPLSKEKGAKKCYILLHNKHNELIWESKVHLHKALGERDIDYGQEIKCRYDCYYSEYSSNGNCFSKEESDLIVSLLHPDNINKYYNGQADMDYFVPYLPCGYIVKVELISNCGCTGFVGYKTIKIVDVRGEDVLKEKTFKRVCVPKEEKGKDGEVKMKYVNLNKEIWNDEEGGDTCCRVYYVFNDVICITRIVIGLYRGDGHEKVNVNKFKLLVDDRLVYEGKADMNNGDNDSNSSTNSKTIWFVNH